MYRLQTGDALEVWVAGETELRRNVVIGPDGWISFPMAGHLKGEGLTLTEMEAALVERLRGFFKEDLNLTIMLQENARHRPMIFVEGDVTTPGAYPYRASMTVLHGVTVAGGFYRTAATPADQDRAVRVTRDIASFQTRTKELALRVARLEAELSGASSFSVESIPASDGLLQQEQQVFESRRTAYQEQVEARGEIDELSKRATKEIRAQMETVRERISLAKQRLESIKTLVSKGAAQGSELLELEGEIAVMNGESMGLSAQITASEQAARSEASRLDGAIQDHRTQLLSDIAAARRDLETTRSRLTDSERILAMYSENGAGQAAAAPRTVEFQILRTVDGAVREIDASELTLVEPGDLLRVISDTPASSRTRVSASAGSIVGDIETESTE